MARPRLSEGRISVSRMCEIAGADEDIRQQWLGSRFIEKCAEDGCNEDDALELTVLRIVMDALGAEDARIAWVSRDKKMFEQLRGGFLDIVYDPRFKTLQITRS